MTSFHVTQKIGVLAASRPDNLADQLFLELHKGKQSCILQAAQHVGKKAFNTSPAG
jgi:hypothetical protein